MSQVKFICNNLYQTSVNDTRRAVINRQTHKKLDVA